MAAKLAMLVLLGACAPPAWAGCNADEMDLCDNEPANGAVHSFGTAASPLVFAAAFALRAADEKYSALAMLLIPLTGMLPTASAAVTAINTCGDVKTFYKEQSCCGHLSKAVTLPGSCPYNFNKPQCANAEPQAPRDLTSTAQGDKTPKAAVLNKAQAAFLPLVNVHFHLGAEHKSAAYSDGSDSATYDASHRRLGGTGEHASGRRLTAGAVRPGFMCSTSTLSTAQTAAYTFTHCKGDVQVGKSYEVHYVHSSAGYTSAEKTNQNIDGIDDGLGGAANGRGQLNPMVVVQAQVFQIVNGSQTISDMLHGWTVTQPHTDAVMYSGSTTGQSHDNTICSPYVISWHVDKVCHQVSPESFDDLCRQMKETYNLQNDLYPHGSRKLLDRRWVVQPQYVVALA